MRSEQEPPLFDDSGLGSHNSADLELAAPLTIAEAIANARLEPVSTSDPRPPPAIDRDHGATFKDVPGSRAFFIEAAEDALLDFDLVHDGNGDSEQAGSISNNTDG